MIFLVCSRSSPSSSLALLTIVSKRGGVGVSRYHYGRTWIQPCRPQLQCQSTHYSSKTKEHGADVEDPLNLVEKAFQTLSRKRCSWERFRDLADMAVNLTSGAAEHCPETLVDVGCDHGLLTASLAASGRFKSVLGIDASLPALEAGALQLQRDVEGFRRRRQLPMLPLLFRLGNGLEGMQPGQADVVCVAGMGVHTIIDVLLTGTTESGDGLLGRLRCQAVLVQPTNCRPRNLFLLYDALQSVGWTPYDERIVYLNSQWYFSVAFRKSENSDQTGECLPGLLLAHATANSSDDESKTRFLDYLTHYCNWLTNDFRSGSLKGGEDRWLAYFDSIRLKQRQDNPLEDANKLS